MSDFDFEKIELQNNLPIDILDFFDVNQPFIGDGKIYTDLIFYDLLSWCFQQQHLVFKEVGIKSKKIQKIPYRPDEYLYLVDEIQLVNFLQRKIIDEQMNFILEEYGFYQYQMVEKIQQKIVEQYKQLNIQPVLMSVDSEKKIINLAQQQQHSIIRTLFSKKSGFVPQKGRNDILLNLPSDRQLISQHISQTLQFSDMKAYLYVKTQPIIDYNIYDVFDYDDVKLLLYDLIIRKDNIKYLLVYSPFIRKSWLINIKRLTNKKRKPFRQLNVKTKQLLDVISPNIVEYFTAQTYADSKNLQCSSCQLKKICKSNYQSYMPVKLL